MIQVFLLCSIYLLSIFPLKLIVCGTDSDPQIFNSHISLYNILPIKCAGDTTSVGSYTEANSLKLIRLVSRWLFLNVSVTTDNVSFSA